MREQQITAQERKRIWEEKNIGANKSIWTRVEESLPPGQNIIHGVWETLNLLRV